jgi:hypothetical protein
LFSLLSFFDVPTRAFVDLDFRESLKKWKINFNPVSDPPRETHAPYDFDGLFRAA